MIGKIIPVIRNMLDTNPIKNYHPSEKLESKEFIAECTRVSKVDLKQTLKECKSVIKKLYNDTDQRSFFKRSNVDSWEKFINIIEAKQEKIKQHASVLQNGVTKDYNKKIQQPLISKNSNEISEQVKQEAFHATSKLKHNMVVNDEKNYTITTTERTNSQKSFLSK